MKCPNYLPWCSIWGSVLGNDDCYHYEPAGELGEALCTCISPGECDGKGTIINPDKPMRSHHTKTVNKKAETDTPVVAQDNSGCTR